MELNREQLRAIIFYNWKRGLTYDQCFDEMSTTLSDNKVSKSTVSYWYRELNRGRDSLEDEPRSGRPTTATDEEMVDRLRKIIKENPRVTYVDLRETLKIGSAAVTTILHQRLGLRKVLSRYVPHLLSNEQKAERVQICRQNLKMLKDGGHRVISRIVTGDETYVHYFDAPTSQESKIWIAEDDELPTVLKVQKTLGKVLYAVFFRSTGLVKAVKLEGQKSVTAKWYTGVCLPEVLSDLNVRGLMLHHDNASSHTASLTQKFLDDNRVKRVPHASYSPDLAMCDFWLFPGLKRHLRGIKFNSEEEIDSAVMAYFDIIPREAWREAFSMWQKRMERCIEVGGDYFEN
jgi:histone-lysine N-methyltransferase SETMAR